LIKLVHDTGVSTIKLNQRSPLALTKRPRLERIGSRYIPRALIRRPHRRSMVSSIPMTTGPSGRRCSNPDGSLFLGPEHPVLELASDMQTALAVSVRKRESFLSCTGEAAIGLEMRELSRRVRGRFADGRDWPSDLDRVERLRRGQAVKETGLDGLLYRPLERPTGFCACILRGEALAERAIQRDHFKFLWNGSRVSTIYSFGSDAVYRPGDLRGAEQILAA
jgi:hypothetical protein